MASLRSYRYRDDKQVGEYLEQIQDGAVAETTVTQEGQRSRGAHVGIGNAGADLGSSRTSSESFTIASTPVSRAAQLETWLGEQVAVLGPMDTEAFAQVERGEFVRFEGTLQVPETVRMAFIGASLGQLADLARAFGQELEGADTIMSQAEALARLVEMDGFPIVAQERYGGPGIMFVARPDLIVGEPMALHGEELTVFGRVKRTIPEGESPHSIRGSAEPQPTPAPTESPATSCDWGRRRRTPGLDCGTGCTGRADHHLRLRSLGGSQR